MRCFLYFRKKRTILKPAGVLVMLAVVELTRFQRVPECGLDILHDYFMNITVGKRYCLSFYRSSDL